MGRTVTGDPKKTAGLQAHRATGPGWSRGEGAKAGFSRKKKKKEPMIFLCAGPSGAEQ